MAKKNQKKQKKASIFAKFAKKEPKKVTREEIVHYGVEIDQHYNPENDYYEILGIEANADAKSIQEAWVEVGMKAEKEDLKKLKKDLVAIKSVLIDSEELKAAYDAKRKEYISSHTAAATKSRVVNTVEDKSVFDKAITVLKYATVVAVTAAICMSLTGCGKSTANEEELAIVEEDNKDLEDATVEETEEVVEEETVEEVDEYAFTDAYNDEQVLTRATAIHEVLVASNINDVTVEELADQIRFINGSYAATSDMDAYDMANNVLETFAEYGTAIAQSANFAGGVVDENGVHQALRLSAFCLDNSEHAAFMNEASILFVNVLTSDTEETKRETSIQFLKQQSDLKLGLIVDETGTQVHYFDLDNNEGFIYGIMSQITAPVIKSALGEDYFIPYTGNLDQKVESGINSIFYYYNPQCGADYNTENVWNQYLTELVVRAQLQKKDEQTLELNN